MTPEEHARALRARGLAFVHRTLDPTARDPSALRTPGSSWRSKMANADVGAFYGTPDVARRRATPEHYRVDGAPTLGSPAFADVTVEPLARSPTTLERKNPPSAAAWSLASPVAMATLDLSRDPSSRRELRPRRPPPSVSPSTSAAAREMSAAAVSAAVMGATAVAEAVMRADVMRADVTRADVRAGRPGRTSAGTNATAKTGTSRLEPGTLAGPIGTVPTVENGTQTPSRVENGTQTADAAVAPPPNPDSLGARLARRRSLAFSSRRFVSSANAASFATASLSSLSARKRSRVARLASAQRVARLPRPSRSRSTWKNSARVAPVWRIRRWRWIAPRRRRISSVFARRARRRRRARRNARRRFGDWRRTPRRLGTTRRGRGRMRKSPRPSCGRRRRRRRARRRVARRRNDARRRRCVARRRRGERRNAPGRWPREI